MTTKRNSVLYTGVTNDLARRVYEHKNKLMAGFTQRYNVTKLVYFETYSHPYEAIAREKKIKGRSRADKIRLVEEMNPDWKDLADELLA